MSTNPELFELYEMYKSLKKDLDTQNIVVSNKPTPKKAVKNAINSFNKQKDRFRKLLKNIKFGGAANSGPAEAQKQTSKEEIIAILKNGNDFGLDCNLILSHISGTLSAYNL